MSQGTPIHKLGGNSMNEEDTRLVDSILNDLNNKPGDPSLGQQGPPQEGGAPQQVSPEQHKAMLAQRQQQMMQQQMMMQQQALLQQQKQGDAKGPAESIMEKLQDEWKGILVVFMLSVLVNMDMIENLFKMDGNTMFLSESGGLNMQATLVKAVAVTVIYFAVTAFVPL
jgi:hypothetical protein